MRRLISFALFFILSLAAIAQPGEPFPIDHSFVPDLSYLQKEWNGSFVGVDPMSRARLSITRTMVLYPDLTFSNVTVGTIQSNVGTSEEMLLKSEDGIYSYNDEIGVVSFVLSADSALDMNAYLRQSEIKYTTHVYDENSSDNTYAENVQFTYEENGARQWVMFDAKLGSDQQQGKPAVYVMTGSEISIEGIYSPLQEVESDNNVYDLSGHIIKDFSGQTRFFIHNGKLLLR